MPVVSTRPATPPTQRVAWTRYALDAQVMCIPGDLDGDWSVCGFRLDLPRLAAGRTPAAAADPGRPGLPPQQSVPAGQTARLAGVADDRRAKRRRLGRADCVGRDLLNDTVAADAAYAATERLCPDSQRPVPSHDVWLRAARTSLDDQNLAKAARACFAAADRPSRLPATPAVLRHVLTDFGRALHRARRFPVRDHLDALCRTWPPQFGVVPAEQQRAGERPGNR